MVLGKLESYMQKNETRPLSPETTKYTKGNKSKTLHKTGNRNVSSTMQDSTSKAMETKAKINWTTTN